MPAQIQTSRREQALPQHEQQSKRAYQRQDWKKNSQVNSLLFGYFVINDIVSRHLWTITNFEKKPQGIIL